MGGDHHHVKIPKVPDPSIYKIEDVPYLLKVQQRLEAKGLKDPWLRNHVWRGLLLKNTTHHPKRVLLPFFTWGWKIWVPLVALTIGVEHFLGIDYHGHSHSQDDHHKEDH